jgi:molybdenum cofactor synthesis domain-containing protein
MTVGLIVIGNEILSGKVTDTNSAFIARELREVGAELRRVAVVADEFEEIGEVLHDFRARYDAVITSGGVGPTHDDVTIEAVARALGRRAVRHPEIEAGIRRFYEGREDSSGLEASLKMAEVPEGAELIHDEELSFPLIKVENIYLFPGIPQILEQKFHAIRSHFAGAPYHLRTLYTSRGEATIAEFLDAVLVKFPDLLLGSYPRIGDPEYTVKVTLESKDRAYVEEALAHLIRILPEGAVVRTEG